MRCPPSFARPFWRKRCPYEDRHPRLLDYLDHIREAIERIHRYVEDVDDATFLEDEMVQDAVIRNFEIIGEASHHIEQRYPEFAAAHPRLPLAAAYQMRNAVAHGYFKVDWQLVWKTIHNDLSDLHTEVLRATEGHV
jgi:uncharacterized protein with HEPN domain